MKKKEKKISIIIRTKNEEQWIEICVRKIFEQTYKNIEIIIVDNNSTDKTLEKIKQYKLKTVKIKKFTPGKAINLGISKSKGEIIVCLSAHCIPVDKFWLKHLVKDLSKNKIAAIYGKQLPLSYSSPLDKRDLYNTFGDEKRVQTKDTFFHNANSAFHKKIWKKIRFDEKLLHIEDRVWANELIKKGFKIIYEPKAKVFHWHGINQSLDEKRCREIVSILENLNYINHKNEDLIKFKKLKCAAVIPIIGESFKWNKKYLLEITINQLKKSKMIDDIFLYSNNHKNKSIAKKMGISSPFKRENNSNFYIDLVSSVKNFVDKLEKKGKFYDLIVIITEKFPFRSYKIFDSMIKSSINNNYDVTLPSQRLKGTIFSKDKSGIKTIVNGTIPSRINKEISLSRIGICTVLKTVKLRTADIVQNQNKIGFYKINDQLSFIEMSKENLNKLKQIKNLDY
jgi:rhamnosyltransferase